MYHALFSVLAQTQIDLSPLPQPAASSGELKTIANIILGIVGSIALLIVTIAGFRFVISQGNPQKIEQARNTIIYASIGLVITISAAAIINFVITNV